MVFSQTHDWISTKPLQWEIVHIAAYLTQKKLNTQQIIAYPSKKQDKISKNKPKKKRTDKIEQYTSKEECIK